MKEIRDLEFLFEYCPEDEDGIMNEFKNTIDDSDKLFSTVLGFLKPTEIKVALIGHQGVGKTCFLERLTTGKFNRQYKATKRYDICEYKHDYLRKFVFYDFSGVDRYAYQDYDDFMYFDIIALMIDYTRISYTDGKKWYHKLLKKNPQSMGIIIKNKIECDCKDANINVRNTFKISVKNNEGIDKVLEKMAMYGS